MEMNEIFMHSTLLSDLIECCKKELPNEGCGLLSGKGTRIGHIWMLPNEIKSNVRFFISKKAVEETIEKAGRLDEDIVAIYHSHPVTAALPSQYDILHHPDPDVLMIIVSFMEQKPDVKAYRILNNRPHRVEIISD